MKNQVKKVFTLSKYGRGMHTFDDREQGEPSFSESLSGLNHMISTLYGKGLALGTKIEVTMKVKSKVKSRKK